MHNMKFIHKIYGLIQHTRPEFTATTGEIELI